MRTARPWPGEFTEQNALNRVFDRIVERPSAYLGTSVPPYLALAVCGIAGGFAVLVLLSLVRGIPIALAVSLAVAALAVFILLGVVRKQITGRESHVLLESVIASLLATAMISAFVGAPVWNTLDVYMPAMGLFVACSRAGCFLSGCCHGRPSRFGVRYGGPAHDALAGIRLFPLQLVESAWLFTIAIVAAGLTVSGAAPGVACWFWLLSYAAARFVLDFARGDTRWRWLRLSEAQWICIAIVVARVVFEATTSSNLSGRTALVFATAAVLVPVSVLTRKRWLDFPAASFTVQTAHELQQLLDRLESDATLSGSTSEVRRTTASGTTSIGLLIDAAGNGQELHSYSLREPLAPIDEERAISIAAMIAQRLPEHQIVRANFCEAGVFHYWALVNPRGLPGSTQADDPSLIHLRALAFAEVVRLAISMSDEPERSDPLPPSRIGDLAHAGAPRSAAWYFRRGG